jgi:hypothetical protein
LAVVEALKNKGLNQSEIAEMFGVTRQYVSWIKHAYGGRLTSRETILRQHWPWSFSAEQTQSSPYRRLRDHAEWIATGGTGKGMSADKRIRLAAFHNRLRDENLVVEFDPDIPPEPDLSNKGGFAVRPRLAEDGDLMIRVKEHTTLTDEGREVWALPDA